MLRDWYPRWTRWPNWLMSELAMARVTWRGAGQRRGPEPVFHIPLLWAVIITGLDVLLLLALQRSGCGH